MKAIARQYIVIQDGEICGKFTIKCRRGKSGGWIAKSHFRNGRGGFGLVDSAEYVNKQDAIFHAYNTILYQGTQDNFTVEAVKKTQWALS